MTEEEQKLLKRINNYSYMELLNHWRFTESTDPIMKAPLKQHLIAALLKKRGQLTSREIVKLSKEVGWKGGTVR